MIPLWLHALAIAWLAAGFASALVIAYEVYRRPQHRWIMDVVWPITGLYAPLLAVAAYHAYGHAGKSSKPFWAQVGTGAMHCGAGCTLGDIAAEWSAFFFPALAVWLGFGTLFPDKLFAVWVLDFALAFILGIAFQYFTIAPMRGLGFKSGLVAALKADTLSLSAWQIGMYGLMAFAQFFLFRQLLGIHLEVNTPEFWFMMQLAMLTGFATSYPVNWLLLQIGWKEAM